MNQTDPTLIYGAGPVLGLIGVIADEAGVAVRVSGDILKNGRSQKWTSRLYGIDYRRTMAGTENGLGWQGMDLLRCCGIATWESFWNHGLINFHYIQKPWVL